MKVSELIGPKLAQWVALALGYVVVKDGDLPDAPLVVYTPDGDVHSFSDTVGWRPDIQWDRGGPIIDREGIDIWQDPNWNHGQVGTNRFLAGIGVHAETFNYSERTEGAPVIEADHTQSGETRLQAAMRCVVASEYGEEVPDANGA